MLYHLTLATSVNVMFSQSSYSIDEDEGSVQIELMLSTSLTTDITIQVISDDDTATSEYTIIGTASYSKVYIGGSDYIAGPYSVIIPAGKTSGLYQISIVVENMTESDEFFHLTINPITLQDGIILGSPINAIVIIRNDDSKYQI